MVMVTLKRLKHYSISTKGLIIVPVKKYEQFKRISNMINIDLIEYGLFCGNDWKYKDLKAPFTRLYIVLEGQAVVLLEHETLQLVQGNAYIIPSNMNFSCYTPKYIKKLYVHFRCEQLAHISLFDKVHQVLKHPITEDYESFLSVLEGERAKDYWNLKGSILQLIYQFIGNLDESLFRDTNKSCPTELKMLYQIMKRGLSAKVRISDLANELEMSQSMLSKLYKSNTGMSLKTYIQQQLMEQAQMSLILTNKSIKEIASDLQYDDPLYFTRVFHHIVGETPTSYRERNRMKHE